MNRVRLLAALVVSAAVGALAACGPGKPAKGRVATGPDAWRAARRHSITGKKILIVQSYHPEDAWVEGVTRGLIHAMAGTGVEFDIVYMDTKRRPAEAWKVRAGDEAAAKVAQYKPDVVVAVDDEAQEYFAMRYVGGELPLVFCGVNADPSRYGYPASNVTGIVDRPNVQDTLELVNRLRPVRKVAVIGGDDPASAGVLSAVKQAPSDFEIVDVRSVATFEEWKQVVEQANATVDALGIVSYPTVKAEDGTDSMRPQSVMDWTVEHLTIPSFGFVESTVNDGALGGVVPSAYEHGKRAAEYALEILVGTPFSSLPVITGGHGTKMVNRRTADRLGINLNNAEVNDMRVVPER